MHEYSKQLDIKLPKGASEQVDEAIKEILATKGLAALDLVAKTNYKNVTRLI
jgi:ribonuclease HIII